MDAEQVTSEIAPVIDSAASIAAALQPQYGALILLGAGLVKAAPQLYADAVALVQKKEPTAEDAAALQVKIAELANPATL